MSRPWRTSPRKPYKARDANITSTMMSRVKNRDSKAELLLRRYLWSLGLRYRLHSKELVGKPDVVFPKYRIAIFVDGDFWHGRALVNEGLEGLIRGIRTERVDWWIAKISKTVDRDRFVTKSLEEEGWTVLRFWESDVLDDVKRIGRVIESRLPV